jgi:hypothetical protein
VSTYNGSGLVYDQSNLTFDGNVAGLSNMPVVGVFVAFDDGPYVADPDWVEVTDYVRDINIRRGRQDDLQQFPSGSCSITFDNRDRTFDPFNTAGTYYGKLKPRRQVRVVGQWAGVNYPLFRGFVAGWPVEFTDGGKDSTVTVDCFDALGLMANETVPDDWTGIYTESLNPLHYWKCNDSQGSLVLSDLYSSSALVRSGVTRPYFFEQSSLGNGLVGNSAFVDSYVMSNQPTVANVAYDFTLSQWIQFSGSSGDYSSFTADYGTIRVALFLYQRDSGVNTQGTLIIALDSVAWGYTYAISQQITANVPRHLVIAVNSTAQTLQIWLDGFDVTGARTASARRFSGLSNRNLTYFGATIQEVSWHNRILTSDEVSNLYNFGSARVKESTTARMNRLINTTDWPAALKDFTATPLASVSEIGVRNGVIPEMQRIVDSEDSDLFVSASGVLTFYDRYGWSENTRSNTSQVTFTDTGTGIYYDAGSLRMNLDADLVRNDSTVQFSSGGVVTATDSTSVADYGAASEQISTFLPDPASAQTLADYRVSIFKNPKLRVEPFLVKGQRNPSYDWPRLLNLELLDRFTFVRTPSVGSAIQKDMLLQSVEHRITPGTWETTINGSARYTGWFILGVSLLGSTEDVLL